MPQKPKSQGQSWYVMKGQESRSLSDETKQESTHHYQGITTNCRPIVFRLTRQGVTKHFRCAQAASYKPTSCHAFAIFWHVCGTKVSKAPHDRLTLGKLHCAAVHNVLFICYCMCVNPPYSRILLRAEQNADWIMSI